MLLEAGQHFKKDLHFLLLYCLNYKPSVSREEEEGSARASSLPRLEYFLLIFSRVQGLNKIFGSQPVHPLNDIKQIFMVAADVGFDIQFGLARELIFHSSSFKAAEDVFPA